MNQAVDFGLLLGGGVLLVSAFSGKSLGEVVTGQGPFTVAGAGSNVASGGVSGVGRTITTGTGKLITPSAAPGAQSIMNYLVQRGFTPVAAAGVVGNLQQESGLNPAEAGGGLAQWIGSRWTNLVNFASSVGLSPSSQQAQLEFLVQEVQSGYSGMLAAMNATSSPAEAATLFSNQYERPGIPDIANRQAYAQSAYAGYAKANG